MDGARKRNLWYPPLVILMACLQGVCANDSTVPVIVSSGVAFVLLIMTIAIVVFAVCYSESWVKSIMKREGKVKMPKSYFRKKRLSKKRQMQKQQEAKPQRTQVIAKPVVSNGGPVPVPVPVPVMNKEKMVQGWNQQTEAYEEKAISMELGEELDENSVKEFQIETSIVDNEVLDVGPFKNLESGNAKPVDGNVYNNPYIFSNNDRSTQSGNSRPDSKVAEGNGLVSVMSNGYGDTSIDIDDIIALGKESTGKNNIDGKVIKL